MRKNDNGFTLLEVVIAMSLLSIVLLAGNQLLFSGLKSWIHGEEQIDVVQNMRVGMDLMTREIRSATGVKTANSNYIIITMTKTDLSTVDVCYQYDSINKELERKEGSSSPQPVSSRISGVTFSYDSGNPIKWVDITMKGQRKDGHETTIKSKVTLRSVRG
ncbi:MAG: prepilin-type N-terminal cleavage/methylation domain-containing protein [Dehalobacterium sp.]